MRQLAELRSNVCDRERRVLYLTEERGDTSMQLDAKEQLLRLVEDAVFHSKLPAGLRADRDRAGLMEASMTLSQIFTASGAGLPLDEQQRRFIERLNADDKFSETQTQTAAAAVAAASASSPTPAASPTPTPMFTMHELELLLRDRNLLSTKLLEIETELALLKPWYALCALCSALCDRCSASACAPLSTFYILLYLFLYD